MQWPFGNRGADRQMAGKRRAILIDNPLPYFAKRYWAARRTVRNS